MGAVVIPITDEIDLTSVIGCNHPECRENVLKSYDRVVFAQTDIPQWNVKKGTLGGLIKSGAAVHLNDTGWIDKDSRVFSNAYVDCDGLIARSTIRGRVYTGGKVVDSAVAVTGRIQDEASCDRVGLCGTMRSNSYASNINIEYGTCLGEDMRVYSRRGLFTVSINEMQITAVRADDDIIQIQAGCQRFDLNTKTDEDLRKLASRHDWETWIVDPVQIMINQYFGLLAKD